MSRSLPTAAKRIGLAENNVWSWVDEVSDRCPYKPLIKMGTGYLEFNPPDFIIKAHQNALRDIDINQYGPLYVDMSYMAAVAAEYLTTFGRSIDADREISVSSGASEGMLSVLRGYLEPEDEVILMEPAFNLYLYLIKWIGGVPKTVSMRPPKLGQATLSSEWTFDAREIEATITPKTKFLILNTPHNPLGKVFSEEELRQIGSICSSHGVFILSDEVYERIAYTPTFPRVAALHPDFARITFTVFSVGKAFNATGWRLGFVIGPAELMAPVQVAHIFQTYVTAGPVQEAAASAYEIARAENFWESNKTMMKAKIESFVEVLVDIGLLYVSPDSAFFMWVDVSNVEVPPSISKAGGVAGKPHDYQVCWLLMQEFGVITIPGSGFLLDQSSPKSHTHLRFTVCKTNEEIELVKTRLKGLKSYIKQ